jgi:hypothetical protein
MVETPMKSLAVALVCATLALAASPAATLADSKDVTASRDAPSLRGMTRADYLAFRESIPTSAEYTSLARRKRDSIDIELAKIDELMSRGVEPDALNEQQKLELFNAHESVVAILNRDESRTVCKKRQEVGSRVPVVECRSSSERDAMRSKSQEELRRHQPRGI